jgi:hypothetical protein
MLSGIASTLFVRSYTCPECPAHPRDLPAASACQVKSPVQRRTDILGRCFGSLDCFDIVQPLFRNMSLAVSLAAPVRHKVVG